MSSSAGSGDSSLRVIVGPTAAGKSALALALAAEHGAAIVSADSRQVYRGFDLGTAKPAAADRARVPHEGLDLIPPTERYSAGRFARDAAGWITRHGAAGRPVVVVGGTGLYVRALVAPFAPPPPLDPARRAALAAWLRRLPRPRLRAWAAALDPGSETMGSAQWRRSIEVALLGGVRLGALQRAHAPVPRAVRYLLLDPGSALRERIAARVEAMVAAGWLDEVRRLAATVPADAPAWQACGYAALRDAIVSGAPPGAALDRTVVITRQYAKRQRTWFRHQLTEGPVTALDPTAPDAPARARAWWRGEGAK
jgi:tRNA dimethylallyltransferase